jgi:hypothetical protein
VEPLFGEQDVGESVDVDRRRDLFVVFAEE